MLPSATLDSTIFPVTVRDRLARPGMKRRSLAVVLFMLAVVAFVWPVHARAVSGVSWDSRHITFTGAHQASCPWRIQLGAMPNAGQIKPPANSDTGRYFFSSYFTANCNAARYNRTSEVLLLVIVGTLVGLAGVRAGRREDLDRPALMPALV